VIKEFVFLVMARNAMMGTYVLTIPVTRQPEIATTPIMQLPALITMPVLQMMYVRMGIVFMVLPKTVTITILVPTIPVTQKLVSVCTPGIRIPAKMATVAQNMTTVIKEFVFLVAPKIVTIRTGVPMIHVTPRPVFVYTPITMLLATTTIPAR